MTGNDTHVIGVACIIQDPQNGRVLLQHRAKDPGSGLYVLPGGKLEAERADVGMARELREELCLDLDPAGLRPVWHANDTLGNGDPLLMLYFRAYAFAGEVRNAEPEKCHGLVWSHIYTFAEADPLHFMNLPMWENDRQALRATLQFLS